MLFLIKVPILVSRATRMGANRGAGSANSQAGNSQVLGPDDKALVNFLLGDDAGKQQQQQSKKDAKSKVNLLKRNCCFFDFFFFSFRFRRIPCWTISCTRQQLIRSTIL